MKPLLWLLATCLFVTSLQGRYVGLLEQSPFLPPDYESSKHSPVKASAKPKKTDHFTLNGISKIGDSYRFSILDKRTQKSKWVKPEEPINGLLILSYDPALKVIEFAWDGENHTVRLTNAEEHNEFQIQLTQNESIGAKTSGSHSPSMKVRSNETGMSENKVLSKNENPSGSTKRELPIVDKTNSVPSLAHKTKGLVSSSPKKVYFNQEAHAANGGPESTTEATNQNATYEDLFASVNIPEPTFEQVVSAPRYKVTRNNTVHNPTGKLPDHLR